MSKRADYSRKPFHRSSGPISGHLLSDTPNWEGALCVKEESETFFPDATDHHIIATAKRICFDCPIQPECSNYALTHNESYGIWGGLTEDERLALKGRKRRRPERLRSPVCDYCGKTFRNARSRAGHQAAHPKDTLFSMPGASA